MAKGSCLCEEVKYLFTGEPVAQAICHCLTCRKLTGSTYSTTLLVPSSSFTILAGGSNIKTHSKKHESGLVLKFSFCGNCGSTIYKEVLDAEPYKGIFIVMAGNLDEGIELSDVKIGAELWVKHRVQWLGELKGAAQCQEFS